MMDGLTPVDSAEPAPASLALGHRLLRMPYVVALTANHSASHMSPLLGFTWLLAFQLTGEALARWLHLPFPGAVLGLLLLLPALAWRPVREPVAGAAGFLLSHLSLLFIPAGVGVLAHLTLLHDYGVRLAVILVVSTWIGMAVTALALRPARESGHD